MIKAILFDMDGVLIDAREWHYDALNDALALFGLRIDRDAHLSTFDGLSTKKKLQILSKTRGLPAELHDFINEIKQKFTESLIYSRCRPTFHHQYAMRELQRRNLRLAVCSNSVKSTVTLMMNLANLDQYLDLQLSNEDVEEPKPSPQIYLEAMRLLKMNPHECLIIEDNDHGYQAAIASGAHVLRVCTPSDVTYDRIASHVATLEA